MEINIQEILKTINIQDMDNSYFLMEINIRGNSLKVFNMVEENFISDHFNMMENGHMGSKREQENYQAQEKPIKANGIVLNQGTGNTLGQTEMNFMVVLSMMHERGEGLINGNQEKLSVGYGEITN